MATTFHNLLWQETYSIIYKHTVRIKVTWWLSTATVREHKVVSDYIIMNKEYWHLWKEAVMAYFNHEKLWDGWLAWNSILVHPKCEYKTCLSNIVWNYNKLKNVV